MNATEIRGDGCGGERHHGRINDLQKFQRAARVFMAPLLMVHGESAPDALRRMADELEWLEAKQAAETAGGDLDPPN